VDRKIAGRRSSHEQPAWPSSSSIADVTQESGHTVDVLVGGAVEIAR